MHAHTSSYKRYRIFYDFKRVNLKGEKKYQFEVQFSHARTKKAAALKPRNCTILIYTSKTLKSGMIKILCHRAVTDSRWLKL